MLYFGEDLDAGYLRSAGVMCIISYQLLVSVWVNKCKKLLVPYFLFCIEICRSS